MGLQVVYFLLFCSSLFFTSLSFRESARALGERCGGRHNVLGVCAAGLRCYIEFKDDANNDVLKTREAENVATGVCVDEDFAKCPSANLTTLTMSSCRPGAIGILVKLFVFERFLSYIFRRPCLCSVTKLGEISPLWQTS